MLLTHLLFMRARGRGGGRPGVGGGSRAPGRRSCHLRRRGAHARGGMLWPGTIRRGAREGLLVTGGRCLSRCSRGPVWDPWSQSAAAELRDGRRGGRARRRRLQLLLR
ncbi:hypothetical protein VPH35_112884 [Triticum aestivum]